MDDTLSPVFSKTSPHSGSGAVFIAALASAFLVPVVMFGVVALVLRGVSSTVGYLLTIFAALIFLALGVWSLRRSGIPLTLIGLTWAKGLEALWMSLAVWGLYGLMLLPLVIGSNIGLSNLFETSPEQILQQWFFVGLGEEVFFRGYILTWLRGRFASLGRARAMILATLLSSLVFSLYHIPQRLFQVWQGRMGMYVVGQSLLLLLLMGALFAYVYLRMGNILLAALAHGGSNCRLIGASRDLIPLFVLILVIELACFVRRRHKASESAQQMTQTPGPRFS